MQRLDSTRRASIDMRRKFLSAAIQGVRKVTPNFLSVDFIVAERNRIRSFLSRSDRRNPSPNKLPLLERKAQVISQVSAAYRQIPLFNSYYITCDVHINNTPQIKLNKESYRTVVNMHLPFKTLLLHRQYPFLLQHYPHFPYEIEEVSYVTIVDGEPPATVYKTKAFIFPPRTEARHPGTPDPKPATVYVLRHASFSNCGVSLSGVISGAKTRLTNKLLRALGERR